MQLVARDIMNPEVLCAQQSWSIRRLAGFLSEHQISGAPVVDDDGNILGVVSVSDIALYVSRNLTDLGSAHQRSDYFVSGWESRLGPEDMEDRVGLSIERPLQESVKTIMTSAVYSVEEDCPIFEMAEIMMRHRIHRLLVTRGSLLVGIVSSLDLLRLLARPGQP
jgi:CBS domain-containing protein